MSYVFPAVILGITGILLILIFRSRQFKKRAAAAYQRILDDLIARTDERMKDHRLQVDERHPFVSDRDKGYLLTLDNTNKKLLIADKDSVSMIDYGDLLSCSLDIQWEDDQQKTYTSITVHIHTSQAQKPLSLQLGTKPAKAEGLLGRYILQSARKIQEICEGIAGENQ
jgi:hypothetical protein